MVWTRRGKVPDWVEAEKKSELARAVALAVNVVLPAFFRALPRAVERFAAVAAGVAPRVKVLTDPGSEAAVACSVTEVVEPSGRPSLTVTVSPTAG